MKKHKNKFTSLDLVDSFRELNPDIKRYTWRGPAKKQARLDYYPARDDY
jgi:exonuclease III